MKRLIMFRKTQIFFLIAAGMVWCGLLVACGEPQPEPASQSLVHKQKVVTEKPEEPLRPDAEAPKAAEKKPAFEPTAALTRPQAAPPQDEKAAPAVPAMMAAATPVIYHPAGKVDPFEPLFKDEPPKAPLKKKKKAFVARTPLQTMDISQFKLVAIIRGDKSGSRALVEESSGKGYVVVVGTEIGNKGGKIIAIDKTRLVVEEEDEDIYGKNVINKRELEMQKPPGEL